MIKLKNISSGALYYIGNFLISVALMVLGFMCAVTWFFSPFEYTNNIIDDVLYYAYNVEKFGLPAYMLRWFMMAAVIHTLFAIAFAIIKHLKQKGESLKR